MDFPSIRCRTDQHAIDTTLYRKIVAANIIIGDVLRGSGIEQARRTIVVRALHLLVVAGGDTAYPLTFTPEFEMNHPVVERTTAPLFVEHLYLEKHHVGAVGLRSLGIAYSRQSQLMGLADGLYLMAAAVGSNSLQLPRFKGDIVEGEEITIALLAFAE